MKLRTKYILPILAALMLLVTLKRMIFSPDDQKPEVLTPPISTDFSKRIGGIGIVEPCSENIQISPSISGVVEKIVAKPGQLVKAGDPLFIIDQKMAKAQVRTAEIELENAKQNLTFYKKAAKAVSKQDLVQQEYNVRIAASKLDELKTHLNLLTVRAPLDAQILRINLKIGEYAQAGMLKTPLIVLGQTELMQTRVEIDETDAQRLQYQKRAQGALRSAGDKKVDLNFVRYEYLIKPKATLVNDGSEKVDTRVLEVIYTFDNKALNAFSGQQMDVFIELSDEQK
jgi:HlyD family secretion protein